MILAKPSLFSHTKKYSGEEFLRSCFGSYLDPPMPKSLKIKIYTFGMGIVPNSIFKVLESTDKLETLDLSMVFSGGIGMHPILLSMKTMREKESTN